MTRNSRLESLCQELINIYEILYFAIKKIRAFRSKNKKRRIILKSCVRLLWMPFCEFDLFYRENKKPFKAEQFDLYNFIAL